MSLMERGGKGTALCIRPYPVHPGSSKREGKGGRERRVSLWFVCRWGGGEGGRSPSRPGMGRGLNVNLSVRVEGKGGGGEEALSFVCLGERGGVGSFLPC